MNSKLQNLVLVQIQAKTSSLAGKAARGVDFTADNMPPPAVMSGGVRHFTDPKIGQVFNSLRKQADAECSKVGFALLRGYAVPQGAVAALDKRLKEIRRDYEAAADKLQKDLPQHYADWEAANPQWIAVLRRDRPEPDEVRKRYSFTHCCYRMRAASDDADDPINDGVALIQGSLLTAILEDAAKTAEQLLERFEGKVVVSKSTAISIAGLGGKLKGLAIIEPAVEAVALQIDAVIRTVNMTETKLSVDDTLKLRGLLDTLTKPSQIVTYGADILATAASAVESPSSAAAAVGVAEVIEPEATVAEAIKQPLEALLF